VASILAERKRCSSLHATSESCAHLADSNVDAYGLEAADEPIKLTSARFTKRRILVCAPSNAAVDEMVLRVMQQGLVDGKGNGFVPAIVRAGVAARTHPAVAGVTLDALVAKEVEGNEADYQAVRSLCHCATCSSLCVPCGFCAMAQAPAHARSLLAQRDQL
jgi:AAA domain